MKKLVLPFCIGFLAVACHQQTAVRPAVSVPSAVSVSAPAVAYLTFDADMTAGMKHRAETGQVTLWYDPGLIRYLEDNHVAATFFVTGMFAELYPDVVKDLAAHPEFSIQNHTYDHAGFEAPCYGLPMAKGDAQKRLEITKTQDILNKLTGRIPVLVRYPGLCHNGDDDRLVAALGLSVSDGTFASGDAFSHNSSAIINQVLSRTKDGSQIVFHLGGPNAPATAAAIREIVPALKARGYVFASLGNK